MNHVLRLVGVLLAVSASACEPTVDGGGGGGGTGEGGASTGEGGASTGEGGADTGEVLDLFACNVKVDCVQNIGHLGEGLTEESLRCGGELVASGEAGALLVTSQPGPDPTEQQTLRVLLGDGTLYGQSRARCFVEDGCLFWTTEWKRAELVRCTTIDASQATGCDGDGPCSWTGRAEDCVVVEAFTCADLEG